MKNSFKTKLLCTALLGSAVFALAACSAASANTIRVNVDMPVAADLGDMASASQFVVRGTFTEKGETWNMIRDSFDISKDSDEFYKEGQLYTFVPTEVLKGDLSLDPIQYNFKTGQNVALSEDSGESSFVEDPMHIEPKLNQDYLLFMSYVPELDVYYESTNPFLLKIEDGKCYTVSNLTASEKDKPKSSYTTKNKDGETIRIEVESNDSGWKDSISGIDYEQAVDIIQQAPAELSADDEMHEG